ISEVPPPAVDRDGKAQHLIGSLDYNSHKGRIAIGRIHRGSISVGDTMLQLDDSDSPIRSKVSWLGAFDGLGRTDIQTASAGEIVAIAGFGDAKIGATLADPADPHPLAAIKIEEPTLKLTFGVNTSPLAA